MFIEFILGSIHNNNNCENFKEFSRKYYSLLDLELIDIIIKYIDLIDDELIRQGLPKLKKDNENGEIKYCIRSILKIYHELIKFIF